MTVGGELADDQRLPQAQGLPWGGTQVQVAREAPRIQIEMYLKIVQTVRLVVPLGREPGAAPTDRDETSSACVNAIGWYENESPSSSEET